MVIDVMDQELREKFAALEAKVELLQGIPSKLDSMIQLQVTMASIQESTRGQTEKLSLLMADVKTQSEMISTIDHKVSNLRNKLLGAGLVMTLIVIPSSAFFYREARDQITSIDKRVTGLEYQIERAKAVR